MHLPLKSVKTTKTTAVLFRSMNYTS